MTRFCSAFRHLLLALGLFALPLQASERPRAEWMEGAVVYGVVPPLFGDAPLSDVTARLDDLDALGVDVLWLAPVYETDDLSAISYSVTNPTGVRADFGSLEELRELVREAHARGIRVIMDVVPNHTAAGHPWFQDVVRHGERSPYFGFYEHGEDATYFTWHHLRNLDFDEPEVRRMVTDSLAFWVRELDVDGFRVDAAWGPQRRRPSFWPEVVRELRAMKPDLFLLAEASACDPYWREAGFDENFS